MTKHDGLDSEVRKELKVEMLLNSQVSMVQIYSDVRNQGIVEK